MMYATVAVTLADAAVAGLLLWIYAGEYVQNRARFTFGLVMFAGFFLAQNLLAAYGYFVLMVFLPDNVQPIMLAIMVLEAFALAVMAYSAAALPSPRRATRTRESLKEGPVRAAAHAPAGAPPVAGGKGP